MRPLIFAASAVMLAAFATPSGAAVEHLNCSLSKPDQTTWSDCRETQNFSRKQVKQSSYKPKGEYEKPKKHYKKPHKYEKCDRECKEHLAKKFKYLHDKKKALLAKLYWKKKYLVSKLYWKKKYLVSKLHKEPNHKSYSSMGGYGSPSLANNGGWGETSGRLGGTLSNTTGGLSKSAGGIVSGAGGLLD